jgi:hypothetical protein
LPSSPVLSHFLQKGRQSTGFQVCQYLPELGNTLVKIPIHKDGDEVAASDFSFKNTTGAAQVDLDQLKGMGDLPEIYVIEEGGSE